MIFLITLVLVTISSSCKKEKLPKPTQEGNNTLGCKIDGRIFVPKDALTFPVLKGLVATYSNTSKEFTMSVSEPRNDNENGFQRYLYIEVVNPSIGKNIIGSKNFAEAEISYKNQLPQRYESNDSIGGIMTIEKFDTVSGIIAGTFSFRLAPRSNTTGILNVSEGRFDIKYK